MHNIISTNRETALLSIYHNNFSFFVVYRYKISLYWLTGALKHLDFKKGTDHMAFLTLKDIGKIYVSEGNVAVGIRGVNASFELGEFVAVTGRSGSGKSTLLNVLSGMDTYEEGELFIEGEPTSHYMQQDWEEYREKYISFIFQDYNIIESFTVLQNVELSLMNIADTKKRREKAIELLTRVGLADHLNHKGSKLSGGQKQRTVIARALAKDSPILLADEPTGNLDSHTSEEIIKLLKEVSKDKLLIMVTHNFDQVSEYATRHIRVFDGAIESDHMINTPAPSVEKEEKSPALKADVSTTVNIKKRFAQFKNGIILGRTRFKAKPKLSFFICLLLTISSLAVTLITSLYAESLSDLFEKNYIFTHIDGRVVIARKDGAVITDDELAELVDQTGASSYQHYDYLLDIVKSIKISDNTSNRKSYYSFKFSYDDFDDIDVGRAPEKNNEVLLRMPISYSSCFKDAPFEEFMLEDVFNLVNYTVTGISYYYDNTLSPYMVFTHSGYELASAICYFSNSLSSFSAGFELAVGNEENVYSLSVNGSQFFISFDIDDDKYYVSDETFLQYLTDAKKQGINYSVSGSLVGAFTNYDLGYYDYGYIYDYGYDYGYRDDIYVSYDKITSTSNTVTLSLSDYTLLNDLPTSIATQVEKNKAVLVLSDELVKKFVYDNYFSDAYTQASLFYSSDAEASTFSELLSTQGYFAVPSYSTAPANSLEMLLIYLSLIFPIIAWVMYLSFFALFLSLCTSKSMRASRSDIAIMRSMGIPTDVIRISAYIQNFIALIIAYLITAAVCITVFLIPSANAMFTFLHAGHYLIIALSMLFIMANLSRRNVKKMFGQSVKTTLRTEA